ncbi:forkhead box protein N1 isoform X2 [Stigmatopora argus]
MSDAPICKDDLDPLETRGNPYPSHKALGISCPQVEKMQTIEAQQARHLFTPLHTAVSRRHSTDGTGHQGPVDVPRFHPYLRQFSEGAVTNAVCLQRGPSPFNGSQEVDSTRVRCLTLGSGANVQCTYPALPVGPAETPHCSENSYSQYHPPYTSASPRQEDTTWPYVSDRHLLSQNHQENNLQPLFPKPIYSYSILIFMALKNSQTGSLPVSEIYSFMTENFPYFKTAPDGWKNSVRHNLSLSKSFEKLEGKHTNSSRKGCLWALNPARVEKLQEELHKWRFKDPASVRRSMARPDLDHLFGHKPRKIRSTALSSSFVGIYETTSTPTRQTHGGDGRPPQYSSALPPSQQSSLVSPNNSHLSDSLALYTASDQQHTTDLCYEGRDYIATGNLPPAYNVTHRDDLRGGLWNQQLEEDLYNVDGLNPSLNDLPLKGNLWEVLQEDSPALHLQTVLTPTYIPSGLQSAYDYSSCMDARLPGSENSIVACGGSL